MKFDSFILKKIFFTGCLSVICLSNFLVKAEAQTITESQKMLSKIDIQIAVREKRVADFLKLPPQERVRFWLETTDWDDVRDALIVDGLDTVPYLVEIIYKGKRKQQVRVIDLLCAMDRFVPNKDFPLSEAAGSIYVKPLKIGGRGNYFMQVDGRRIGKTGFDAVMWLAEQNEDEYLRFHARYLTGLLEQDLGKLSLKEQIILWRESAIKSKGRLGWSGSFQTYKAAKIRLLLGIYLIKQAPESLPPLIEMLRNENENRYVRSKAIGLIFNIDLRRMRLRKTKIGREAIEVVRVVLEGNLEPSSRSSKVRKLGWTWEEISPKIFEDKVGLNNSSNWSIVALAFEQFYGEDTVIRNKNLGVVFGKPIMREFVTYLTNVDSHFLSWEYFYAGSASHEEVLHPDFKKKIERYYKHWKKFKAERNPQ